MSENEAKAYLKKAKKYITELSSSKDKAQQFLKDTRIYTATGKLAANYK